MKEKKSALVLLSGGQDSMTCLYWAKRKFDEVQAIGFSYGQKHEIELEQAALVTLSENIRFHIIDITGTGILKASALMESHNNIVPGRNAIFLTMAISFAYTRGITDIVAGMCQTDFSGFPDCRKVFIDSLQTMMSLALDKDIRIHTPLMFKTKAETWKLAYDLGVLEIIRKYSHTDYNGDRTEFNEWGYGKLDNPASILRMMGYEEAKQNGWLG